KTMIKLFPIIFVLFLSACSTDDMDSILNVVESNDDNAEKQEVTVNRVVDGDTVDVEMPDGTDESVRLLLIDTPESVHPNKPTQPYGEEASDYAKERLPEGETIKLEYDGDKRG